MSHSVEALASLFSFRASIFGVPISEILELFSIMWRTNNGTSKKCRMTISRTSLPRESEFCTKGVEWNLIRQPMGNLLDLTAFGFKTTKSLGLRWVDRLEITLLQLWAWSVSRKFSISSSTTNGDFWWWPATESGSSFPMNESGK